MPPIAPAPVTALRELKLSSNPHPVVVTQLRYAHAFKAAKTTVNATAEDPLVRYMRNGRKMSRGYRAFHRAVLTALIPLFIRSKVSLTVKNGTAFVIATPSKHGSGQKDPGARLAERLATFLIRKINKMVHVDPEGPKRRKEFDDKMKEAVSKVLGDRVDYMWYVDNLATDPASQGQGYGGALLDAVTSMADLMSQAVWLQSSNIDNTGFYNLHGFTTICEVVVGDGNPTWHDPPVVVSIMIRKQGGGVTNEKPNEN